MILSSNIEFVCGPNLFREMRFEQRGDEVKTHRHNFGHTTFVVRGAVTAQKLREDPNGIIEIMDQAELKKFSVVREVRRAAVDGRSWLYIEPGEWHRFVALEQDTLAYCVYAHQSPRGGIVQEYDGWGPAYA